MQIFFALKTGVKTGVFQKKKFTVNCLKQIYKIICVVMSEKLR